MTVMKVELVDHFFCSVVIFGHGYVLEQRFVGSYLAHIPDFWSHISTDTSGFIDKPGEREQQQTSAVQCAARACHRERSMLTELTRDYILLPYNRYAQSDRHQEHVVHLVQDDSRRDVYVLLVAWGTHCY